MDPESQFRYLTGSSPTIKTTPTITRSMTEDIDWYNNKRFYRDYEVIKEIGEGGFATTYLVVSRKDQSKYVLKILKSFDIFDVREPAILNSLQKDGCHPNIICFVDNFYLEFDPTRVTENITKKKSEQQKLLVSSGEESENIYRPCMLFHYVDGIDGDTFIENNSNLRHKHTLKPDILLRLLEQGLSALSYIHSNHVVHNDIKPGNLIIDDSKNYRLTLIDFGSACNRQDALCFDVSLSDFKYLPEERLLYPSKTFIQRIKGDVWALGLAIYELMVFEHQNLITHHGTPGNIKLTFNKDNYVQMIEKLFNLSENYQKTNGNKINPYQILDEMLQLQNRPTAQSLYKKYFS